MKELKLSLIIEAINRAAEPLEHVSEGLEKIERRAEKVHHAFHKLGLAEFIGGALFTGTLVEGAHQVFELTDKTAELGEEFLHAAAKAGTSVEAIQRLRFAAKQLGGEEDGLSTVFFRFQTHLANAIMGSKETRGALKQLGIPLRDLKELSKDPVEAFLRLTEGFHRLVNPTQRAKLAMDLFGRSGVEMLPVLVAGREGVETFMAQLDAAHAVMSTEDARASEEFVQRKRSMTLALQGLQIHLGAKLLEPMTRFIDKLSDMIVQLSPAVIDRFTAAIGKLIEQLPALIELFGQFLEWTAAIVPKVIAFTDKAGGLKTVLNALAVIVGTQLLVGLGQTVFTVVKGVVAFGEFLGVITSLIELSAGVATFADAMALLDIALDANPIGVLILTVGALVAVIAAVGVAVYQIYRHWDGVTKWFKGLWDGVETVFSSAWKRLSDMTPDWLKTLFKIGAVGATIALAPGAAPAVAGALVQPRPGAPTPPPSHAPARASAPVGHLHIHFTSDGAPQVKRLSASRMDITVHRGPLEA